MPTLWVAAYGSLQSQMAPAVSIFYLGLVFYFLFVLLVTTITDLEFKIIPDEASFGLIMVGLALSPFNPMLGAPSPVSRIIQSAIGGSLGWGLLFFIATLGSLVWKKDVMGGGDIKLLAGIGTILGWPGILTTIFIASLTGGVLSILGVAVGILKRNHYIPFGPFINVGALCAFYFQIYDFKILDGNF